MNFDFSDDQKELQGHVRKFFDGRSSSEVVRAVLDGDEFCDTQLWDSIVEMGYTGTAIPEAYGGFGMGYLEQCIISEELGRSLAPVPFSSSIYLAAGLLLEAGSEEQKQKWLPMLVSGEAIGTFAVVESVGQFNADSVQAVVKSGTLNGVKQPVTDGELATVAIVAAKNEAGKLQLYIAPLDDSVSREAVTTLDPTRGHARITFSNTKVEKLGDNSDAQSVIAKMYDRAAVLFAFEQIGGADRALEMARDYALERRAFGRQIGSFQAIKHMLADMYVSATLARSNAYYAAWALSTDADELPQAAAAARLSATRAFQHCSKNNIQVHGGMGFTWEFDCHLYYRRSNLLALNLGAQSYWEDRLIENLKKSSTAA